MNISPLQWDDARRFGWGISDPTGVSYEVAQVNGKWAWELSAKVKSTSIVLSAAGPFDSHKVAVQDANHHYTHRISLGVF